MPNNLRPETIEILTKCLERYDKGAKEYGENTFMDNDNLAELLEELYDVINYAAFTIMQVKRLQENLALNPKHNEPKN